MLAIDFTKDHSNSQIVEDWSGGWMTDVIHSAMAKECETDCLIRHDRWISA